MTLIKHKMDYTELFQFTIWKTLLQPHIWGNVTLTILGPGTFYTWEFPVCQLPVSVLERFKNVC